MTAKRLSSTELKRNTAEVLNTVAYGGTEVVVEKYGEPFVRIVPLIKKRPKMSKKEAKRLVDKYFGISPDFPEVTKMRYFRKKDISW